MMKFIHDAPQEQEIDIRKLIQILKDIKSIKNIYPELTIKTKSGYKELKISDINESNAEIELEYGENIWIVKSHTFPEKATQGSIKVGSSTTLQRCIESCTLLVNNLREFYDTLEVLDTLCNILEPVVITPNINWRLIKYNDYVFIKIEFLNALNVREFKISFHGKNHLVKEVKALYNNYKEVTPMVTEGNDDTAEEEEEEEEPNIYQKLCTRLQVPYFPANVNKENVSCSICLDYHNDNKQCPIVCCENPKCDKMFHATCISQHLNINSYKILSVACGTCPFCKQKISILDMLSLEKSEDQMEIQ